MHTFLYEHMFTVLLSKCLEWGWQVKAHAELFRSHQTVSTAAGPSHLPLASYEQLHFRSSKPALTVLPFWPRSGAEVASQCGFDLHFPDDWWCCAALHVLVGHLCIFGVISAQNLCLFFIGLPDTVLWSCIFTYFRCKSFVWCMCWGYFLPDCDRPFLIVFFKHTSLLILIKLNLSIFSFMFCVFVFYLRNICLTRRHKDCSPTFSFSHFIVLGFPFRFVICSGYFCI